MAAEKELDKKIDVLLNLQMDIGEAKEDKRVAEAKFSEGKREQA